MDICVGLSAINKRLRITGRFCVMVPLRREQNCLMLMLCLIKAKFLHSFSLKYRMALFQICKFRLVKNEANSCKRLYNKIKNFRNGWGNHTSKCHAEVGWRELGDLWVRQRGKVICKPSPLIENKQLIILGTVKLLITYNFFNDYLLLISNSCSFSSASSDLMWV